jgi:hypothetical protein
MSNVYFLQVGTDGPIKIGCTKNDIQQRVRAMQLTSPHILRWIGYFPGDRAAERQAHLLLKNSSLRGEWFYPTVEVLAFVAQKSPGFEPIVVENNPFQHPPRSAESRAQQSKSMLEHWERKRKRQIEREGLNS